MKLATARIDDAGTVATVLVDDADATTVTGRIV